jgi:hypothetical protein
MKNEHLHIAIEAQDGSWFHAPLCPGEAVFMVADDMFLALEGYTVATFSIWQDEKGTLHSPDWIRGL